VSGSAPSRFARVRSAEAWLLAASAKYSKAALVGGDEGRSAARAARRALSGEAVKNPKKWIAWAAVGFGEVVHEHRCQE
jgi:hypothetical protein